MQVHWKGGDGLVVGLDEGEQLLGEVFFADERAVAQQAAGEDGEEDLDLVEPGRVLGRELKPPPGVLGQPVLDLLGGASGQVVGDGDDPATVVEDLVVELVQKADQVKAIAVLEGIASTSP